MSGLPTSESQADTSEKSHLSGWLTFFLGFFAGLLLAFIGFEKWSDKPKSEAPDSKHVAAESAAPEAPPVVAQHEPLKEPPAHTAGDSHPFEAPEHDMEITKAMRDRMLTVDFLDLLQDADLHRFRFEGETKGVVLSKIRTGSIYAKAGFKDGDIIEQVNGIAVADIEKRPSKMKHDLPAADRIMFTVRRSGKVIKIQVRVAGLQAE
jgi:type II secretory pathway component PulC